MMIKFFRSIRQKLLAENKAKKYLIYALGEIVLVVIGILIALSINNWNEERKETLRLKTNIKTIAKDLIADTIQISNTINVLHKQVIAGELLIPIMESNEKFIEDSLEFILTFNYMTHVNNIPAQKNTWDYLNSSGLLADFPDQTLINMLQEYYPEYYDMVSNYSNSAIPARLEIRRLKYELFPNSEHIKFFPTSSPKVPGKIVYDALLKDSRVLPLCRFISSTAIYFEDSFKSKKSEAKEILKYIEDNHHD